jgi:hypothetical protein
MKKFKCVFVKVPPARRTGPRPFIKLWSLDHRPMALIEQNEGVPDGSNLGRHPEDGRCGLIPLKRVATRGGGGLHGGALAPYSSVAARRLW